MAHGCGCGRLGCPECFPLGMLDFPKPDYREIAERARREIESSFRLPPPPVCAECGRDYEGEPIPIECLDYDQYGALISTHQFRFRLGG